MEDLGCGVLSKGFVGTYCTNSSGRSCKNCDNVASGLPLPTANWAALGLVPDGSTTFGCSAIVAMAVPEGYTPAL